MFPTWHYKQEIIEVPGLVTAIFITYDNQRDDSREIHTDCTWDYFLTKITAIDPDWDIDPRLYEADRGRASWVYDGWLAA